MNSQSYTYPGAVMVSASLLLMLAYTMSHTTTDRPYQLVVAQTTQGPSSPLTNLTSENIEDLEIMQESINDARENIHGNNTAEALEELNTINKVLLRLRNDTFTS